MEEALQRPSSDRRPNLLLQADHGRFAAGPGIIL